MPSSDRIPKYEFTERGAVIVRCGVCNDRVPISSAAKATLPTGKWIGFVVGGDKIPKHGGRIIKGEPRFVRMPEMKTHEFVCPVCATGAAPRRSVSMAPRLVKKERTV